MSDQIAADNPFMALFPSSNAAQNFIAENKDNKSNDKSCLEDEITAEVVVESLLCLTINKDRKSCPWKTPGCLVYISEPSAKIDEDGFNNSSFLNQVLLDRVLMTNINADHIFTSNKCTEELKLSATETKAIPYLFHCYCRCIKYEKEFKTRQDIVKSCCSAVMNSSVVAIAHDQSIADNEPCMQLFNLLSDNESYIVKYMDDVARLILEDGEEAITQAINPLFEIFHEKLSSFTFGETLINSFISLLRNIFQESSVLTEYLIKYCYLESESPGIQFQNTLLGCIFRLSCLPHRTAMPFMFFNHASGLNMQEQKIVQSNIWLILDQKISDIYMLLRLALKSSPSTKDAILTFLSQVIRSNTGRTRLENHHELRQAGPAVNVSDGFMLNLMSAMLILCEPFIEPQSVQNVLKANPKFLAESVKKNPKAAIHLYNMPTETCLMSANEDATDDDHPLTYNFVTECFFMTHWCVHTGFSVAHSKIQNSLQNLRRQQQLLDDISNQSGDSQRNNLLEQMRDLFEKDMTRFLCTKTAMMLPHAMDNLMKFSTATAIWLVNVALGNKSTKSFASLSFPLPDDICDDLSLVPEFIVENITEFVIFAYHFSPAIFEQYGESLDHLMTFILVFMGNPKAVKNPHLRAKLAEMLECLIPKLEQEQQFDNILSKFYREKLFTSHAHIEQLMATLLHVFVSIEMTGQSVEFEQKFNYRRPMYVVLEYIWTMDVHRDAMKKLVCEAEENMESVDPPLFLRFINLLINDAIFLLDEALSYMKQIREHQERSPDSRQPEEDVRNPEIRHLGMMARYHNTTSKETIHALMFITKEIKSIFMHPVLVNRIAAMLNYFLVHLAGPKNKEFKVKDFAKYGFKPQQILSEICQIYLSLGSDGEDCGKFCLAIAKDGRSFTPKLFQQALAVLQKIGRVDIFLAFEGFAEKVEGIYKSNVAFEESMDDIPEEFLDPIMSTLMEDPVLLPTSGNIVDRATISRILLSDQMDPFNRKPLTMDVVQPATDLKARIDDWVKSHMPS